MIVLDAPANYLFRGRRTRASHLISTEPGLAGRRELLAFAVMIGMKREWLQRPGTEFEHFDLLNSRIERALDAGAVKVDRRRVVDIVRAKRTEKR